MTFRFLNVEGTLDSSGDWNRESWPKLWLYNLHYFDDLVSEGAMGRTGWHRELILRWAAENPPRCGVGWEPYPTSLRIVNWIKWVLAGNVLDASSRTSLSTQTRWLRKRLEVHLLGNHLWANAKALIFAGTYFRGREADAWRNRGLSILRRELDEQILADGGHFERSPMYHAILLEDLLDLVQLAGLIPGVIPDEEAVRWREKIPQMFHWLQVMTHPDGGIAFFNDAALGVAPSYAALMRYARLLGEPIQENALALLEVLPESGYVRLESGAAVLIADVGEVGPDYLPGHAHADTLSFELSLHGKRVLVNGGTSTYQSVEERLRERGTATHNTVEVNGTDSSEVWGSFRVARRARPDNVFWAEENGVLLLHAMHDGYERLRGVGKVVRIWRLDKNRLEVIDRVEGDLAHSTARFRADPSFEFVQKDEAAGVLKNENISLRWSVSGAVDVRIVPGLWHPGFGLSEGCQVMEADLSGGGLQTEFTWN